MTSVVEQFSWEQVSEALVAAGCPVQIEELPDGLKIIRSEIADLPFTVIPSGRNGAQDPITALQFAVKFAEEATPELVNRINSDCRFGRSYIYEDGHLVAEMDCVIAFSSMENIWACLDMWATYLGGVKKHCYEPEH